MRIPLDVQMKQELNDLINDLILKIVGWIMMIYLSCRLGLVAYTGRWN